MFFIIGGVADLSFNRYLDNRKKAASEAADMSEVKKLNNFFNNLYNENFFNLSRDPFAEMRRLQDQVFKDLNQDEHFQDTFSQWYQKRFGGDVTDLGQSEDTDFIYYDINLPTDDLKDFKVVVRNQKIKISGEYELNKKDDGSSTSMSSSFQRSFPLPPSVDADNYQVERQDKKRKLELNFGR